MTDHHIREAERQYEAEMASAERVTERYNELLPEVLANPNDHNIDVDLLDNGDFAEFLYATFAKPDWNLRGVEIWKALYALNAEYERLAEKAAENLAVDEITREYEDDGYTE